MIELGEAAKYVRNRLGLSQRRAGEVLGISHIHINNVENGKTSPSPAILEKYFDAFGIDLYMVAIVLFSDAERLPKAMRSAAGELKEEWDRQLERTIIELQGKGFHAGHAKT